MLLQWTHKDAAREPIPMSRAHAARLHSCGGRARSGNEWVEWCLMRLAAACISLPRHTICSPAGVWRCRRAGLFLVSGRRGACKKVAWSRSRPGRCSATQWGSSGGRPGAWCPMAGQRGVAVAGCAERLRRRRAVRVRPGGGSPPDKGGGAGGRAATGRKQQSEEGGQWEECNLQGSRSRWSS